MASRWRATNKRFLSAELNLLGDVLGFVRYISSEAVPWPERRGRSLRPVHYQFTTFNCDSLPIPFASPDNCTVEKTGARRVSIIQYRGEANWTTAKQRSTSQMVRPKGKQPYPTVLFRGKTYENDEKETSARSRELPRTQCAVPTKCLGRRKYHNKALGPCVWN